MEKRIGLVEREVKQSNAKGQLPQNNARNHNSASNRERRKGYKDFGKNRAQFRGY